MAASVPHHGRVYERLPGANRPIYCSTETCGSGLTGAPGERVTPQGVQEFKSLRLRHPSNPDNQPSGILAPRRSDANRGSKRTPNPAAAS